MLSGPRERDPLNVTRRLLAIQGQDPRAARLAIRARSRGVTSADVDRALTEERSLVLTWLARGTLHLVASEDYPWLHALMTPPLRASSDRRLAQEGMDHRAAVRGVAVIERALGDAGPLTRHDLRERLSSAGLPVAGQALIHLLYRASLEGVIVRGPMAGREHAYALTRDWLAPAPVPVPVPSRAQALAELAHRYLAGHGPADERDLARWSGLPLRDARAGLEAISGRLRSDRSGLLDLADRPRTPPPPAPRLLGAFEPLLLGWTSRERVLGPHAPRIVSGGIFRSFALVRGRAVAGWRWRGEEIVIEPFEALTAADTGALEREAVGVRRFLGRS